jgi:predicted nucleic acid-binding Zn ribbon protein
VKKVATFFIAAVVLCGAAAAYGATTLDGEGAETSTIAQASKDAYCPACGAKNPAGAAYCSSCGKAIPKETAAHCPGCGAKLEPGSAYCASCGSATSRPAGRKWDRNVVAISGNAGGFFVNGSFGYVGTECAFQVADYFAFGPEFSYFFGGHSTGLIAGLEFRPYFVPYSRSTFVKPHAYFGGGYLRETVKVWIFEATGDGGYARAGGGVDFRIPGNDIIVPYFDLGAFTTFSNGESITRVQFEGGVRFAL